MEKVLDKIQFFTESLVNKRREKKAAKKREGKTVKSEVFDWLSAYVFAIVFVYLLSMWACQQYVVPTGSMETTIPVGDRLIANKRAYGTELIAYGHKRDDKTPERGDIITFHNPLYERASIFKENLRDLVYLSTITLVNPNKDAEGRPLEKMFIKRAVGVPGDTVILRKGDVYIKRFGESEFKKESDLSSAVPYQTRRLVQKDSYEYVKSFSVFDKYFAFGKAEEVPNSHKKQLVKAEPEYVDYYEYEMQVAKNDAEFEPFKPATLTKKSKNLFGIYVNNKHILPLGDNRDQSHDGRFFGPVHNENINGKASFVFFPLTHIKKL